MKKIIVLLFSVFFISTGFSATFFWVGGSNTNFSDATNWGPTFLAVPGAADDIIFNSSSSNNCDLNIGIDVNSLSILSGYTGIIDGLSNQHTIRDDFSQAAGTFIAPDNFADLTIGGNITFTGGTFNNNGGVVLVIVNDLVTTTISGAIAFNELEIIQDNVGAARIIDFGTSASANILRLNGSGRLFSYQGNITILSGLAILGTATGVPPSNSGTFTFSGAGPISISGAGNSARNRIPNVVFNTTGNISMSSNINVQGNWTGTNGTLTNGTSIVNMSGTSASILGTKAAFDNLTILTGATVAMPSNAEVKIGGTLTRTGTLNFQTTTALGLNGSGAQTISGSAFTLAGIKAYNGSRTVTMSAPVTILDSLKVGINVTFASGGNVTLASNASLTGRIAKIENGGTITGNVIVQTFIPGGTTGWANLGVRGVSGQMASSWDTWYSSNGATGIPMVCNGCFYGPEFYTPRFHSIYSWGEALSSYDTLPSNASSAPLAPGKGFWVYVGDGQSTTTGLTLVNTGAIVTGNQSILLTSLGVGANKGFNLVANPYASPISWASVLATNGGAASASFNNAIYIWNANLGTSGQTTSYIAGAESPGGIGSAHDTIPGGQGFYVESKPAGGTLLITESDKSAANTSADPLLKQPTNYGKIFRLKLSSGNGEWDATTFRLHEQATPLFDAEWDARKIFQSPAYAGYTEPYTKYTSISSKDGINEDYSIHSIPLLYNDVKIPVLVRVAVSGSYTIQALEANDLNTCLILKDNLLNKTQDLKAGSYVFSINDSTSATRFELQMCRDESLNTTAISEVAKSGNILIRQDANGAFVYTNFPQNTKATISVYNVIGQKLTNDIQVSGTETNTRLNLDLHNQVVLIKVTTNRESITKKIVIQ